MAATADLGVPGNVRTAQRFARLGLIDEYVLHVHLVAMAPASRCSPRRPT
ncbi:MAG TPA: hypothetical protein VFQ68_03250 [Streptosporangiaceae bacterium]|nr:hypothetical protein [Streptosporangiaceae bacterium]